MGRAPGVMRHCSGPAPYALFAIPVHVEDSAGVAAVIIQLLPERHGREIADKEGGVERDITVCACGPSPTSKW